jgi:hypothetical protein
MENRHSNSFGGLGIKTVDIGSIAVVCPLAVRVKETDTSLTLAKPDDHSGQDHLVIRDIDQNAIANAEAAAQNADLASANTDVLDAAFDGRRLAVERCGPMTIGSLMFPPILDPQMRMLQKANDIIHVGAVAGTGHATPSKLFALHYMVIINIPLLHD